MADDIHESEGEAENPELNVAEEGHESASFLEAVNSRMIDELHMHSDDEVEVDLSHYFTASDPKDKLEFSIEEFPAGLTIDHDAGIVSGTAPKVSFNTPYLASIKATSVKTGDYAIEYFPIIVFAAAEVGKEEASNVLPEIKNMRQIIDDVSYMDPSKRWQLQRLIQYIINQHWASVYFFDRNNPPDRLGKFIGDYKLTSGFSVYEFENYLFLYPGDMAFEEYGNRARFLKSIEEVYVHHLPKKKWEKIGLGSGDPKSVEKAWLVGTLLDMPVSDTAPSDEAIFSLRSLRRIVGERAVEGKRLIP